MSAFNQVIENWRYTYQSRDQKKGAGLLVIHTNEDGLPKELSMTLNPIHDPEIVHEALEIIQSYLNLSASKD